MKNSEKIEIYNAAAGQTEKVDPVVKSDAEWKKLSSTPGYTDPEIVTNISNVFLRPAPYSQI